MPREWASSLDLHVELAAGGGRRAAVEHAVRAAIRDGRLRPGDRLPSTRALAADLGLARGTVAEAYGQLVAEGYLHTSAGAPTRVAEGLLPAEADPGVRAAPASSRHDVRPGAPEPPPSPRFDARAGAPESPPVPRFDLRPGVPDLGAFPRSAWLRAVRRVLATAPAHALTGDDPRGRPELRQALAGYLGRARGVLADPERIVVCSGFTQGMALITRALRDSGVRVVAMEDPCLDYERAIVADAGLSIAPLVVDDAGARSDVPAGAGAAVITPAHQFPLGGTLAPERRSAFVAWARASGGIVVEDDYDGEFRYGRQPPGALQGLDPEHVVYAGTASKTLTPGLRLGWLLLPRRLLDPVVEAKRLAGDTQALDQLALAELLDSGAFDRHVRRARQRYRRRRDRLLGVLARHAPSLRTLGVAAGLHLVLELPDGVREAEVEALGAERSLALSGLGPYWHRPEDASQGLILGYAAPPEHAYAQTLAAFAGVLDELRAGGASSRATVTTGSRG